MIYQVDITILYFLVLRIRSSGHKIRSSGLGLMDQSPFCVGGSWHGGKYEFIFKYDLVLSPVKKSTKKKAQFTLPTMT